MKTAVSRRGLSELVASIFILLILTSTIVTLTVYQRNTLRTMEEVGKRLKHADLEIRRVNDTLIISNLGPDPAAIKFIIYHNLSSGKTFEQETGEPVVVTVGGTATIPVHPQLRVLGVIDSYGKIHLIRESGSGWRGDIAGDGVPPTTNGYELTWIAVGLGSCLSENTTWRYRIMNVSRSILTYMMPPVISNATIHWLGGYTFKIDVSIDNNGSTTSRTITVTSYYNDVIKVLEGNNYSLSLLIEARVRGLAGGRYSLTFRLYYSILEYHNGSMLIIVSGNSNFNTNHEGLGGVSNVEIYGANNMCYFYGTNRVTMNETMSYIGYQLVLTVNSGTPKYTVLSVTTSQLSRITVKGIVLEMTTE